MYVDDLTTVNNSVTKANRSHSKVCFFADKKKSLLNEDKCYLLPLNCKSTDPVPIQEINGKPVTIKDSVKCLGDIFNQKGTYTDLLDDRVRRGTACTVNSMALCNDSEMGKYAIASLTLLYRTVFLPTVLYNSETWNNLSKNDCTRLQTLQNKYLKWMLHTPKGTCTAFTLLELGLLPIHLEIEVRKLNFLHHILNLPSDDPVKLVYEEQKMYDSEPNWYNEITALLQKHKMASHEDTIKSMSKQSWNNLVKRNVRRSALKDLNEECRRKSKTANISLYNDLSQQEYFLSLSPAKSRMYFQIRAGVYDLKKNRQYMYDDLMCRLCEEEEETIEHILNQCTGIERNSISITNIYDVSPSNISIILSRVEQFKHHLMQKEEQSTSI